MESSLKKKQRMIYQARGREFCSREYFNKLNADVNTYTDCQSAYDIYLFNNLFTSYFVIPFSSSDYFADRKKTVTLTNALVVNFTASR